MCAIGCCWLSGCPSGGLALNWLWWQLDKLSSVVLQPGTLARHTLTFPRTRGWRTELLCTLTSKRHQLLMLSLLQLVVQLLDIGCEAGLALAWQDKSNLGSGALKNRWFFALHTTIPWECNLCPNDESFKHKPICDWKPLLGPWFECIVMPYQKQAPVTHSSPNNL